MLRVATHVQLYLIIVNKYILTCLLNSVPPPEAWPTLFYPCLHLVQTLQPMEDPIENKEHYTQKLVCLK